LWADAPVRHVIELTFDGKTKAKRTMRMQKKTKKKQKMGVQAENELKPCFIDCN